MPFRAVSRRPCNISRRVDHRPRDWRGLRLGLRAGGADEPPPTRPRRWTMAAMTTNAITPGDAITQGANTIIKTGADADGYARSIRASKRVRWDIDEDVIRGRAFDRSQKYLPDGLSLLSEFTTLSADERRFV